MATQYCTQCGSELIAEARFCSACGAEVKESASQDHVESEDRQPSSLKPNSAMGPRILVAAGVIILLVASMLFLFNSNRPDTVSSSTATLPGLHSEAEIPYPEVPRIPPAEAKAEFDAGTALIVDVRSQEEYDAARVANAISLPLTELDARYRELPQDIAIITYCT